VFLTASIDDALEYYQLVHQAAKGEGKRLARAKLGQTDLFYLLTQILHRDDLIHPWLFARCRDVQISPNGHLDLWARDHRKSSIITFGLTIQDIINNPELTVGIFSHTRGIAKGFLRWIMREFETNDELKELYPHIFWNDPKKQAPKWSEDDGVVVKRRTNRKESTVEAWGLVDGQPTSRHFGLRIYDDVVTLESVASPDQIRKTTLAWEMSNNLGEQGGRERYIGTRYALFDTYSTMLERQVVVPRLHPATADGRLDGEPVLLSKEEWDLKKKTQRSTIAAQMLQNPLSGEDQTFMVDWLKPYEIRPKLMNVVILCDPSLGRSAKSDRTAIPVIGVSSTGGKYLLDGVCHRMPLSERWQTIRDLHKKWARQPGCTVLGVGYERYGHQSDVEYMEERMRIENYAFPLRELAWPQDNTRSKATRIARLEPDFRLGRFLLPLPVWRRGIGAAVWKVDSSQVTYSAMRSMTTPQRDAMDRGDAPLLARAIKQADENGEVYDLTIRWIEEYADHPYGQHEDLIDAGSRIYDMGAVAPVVPEFPDQGGPQSYWDA
jgi:hypothetical protein